jgi:hypothetical protein
MSRHDDQLRQSMRGYAARLAEAQPLPQASLIWFRAERRRRRLALERAERPLRVMQIVGVVCAMCATAWMLFRSVSVRPVSGFGTPWIAVLLACAFLIPAGCWAMVVASRRPLS